MKITLKIKDSLYGIGNLFKLLVILILVLISLSLGRAQNRTFRATGLIPASEEQLRGIPLASVPFSGDRKQNSDRSSLRILLYKVFF